MSGHGRCVQCGRIANKTGQHLYDRPDGSEAWLCGRPKPCAAEYNGPEAEPGELS